MKTSRSARGQRPKTLMLGLALWSGLNWAADTPSVDINASTPKSANILQRALHYEWMLGNALGPEMAACVEARVGDKWSLPVSVDAPPSERLVERVQRAHEYCSAALASDQLDFDRRFIVQSLRKQLKEQTTARQSLEETKVAARTCITKNEDAMQFKRCMEQSAPAVLTELTWPRWLTLFEQFVRQRSSDPAHKPD
jgi:hypothetical protein